MTLELFLARLKKVKRTQSGFVALCPAHDDNRESLSISLGENGRILVKCFSGCTASDVVKAIALEMKDLFINGEAQALPANGNGSKGRTHDAKPNVEAVYQYFDDDGVLLYENVRFRPKEFRPRRPDGVGGYIYNLDGVKRVPYRLPDLITEMGIADAEILLAEGEKDADNLRSLGFTASSFKNWNPDFSRYIKGARVVLSRDHDEAGVRQAEAAASILSSHAVSVKIIDLFANEPIADKNGKDVSDWIETQRNEGLRDDEIAERLAVIAKKASAWQGAAIDPAAAACLKVKRISDVESLKIEWLIKPLIPFSFFTLCDGLEGIGKTFMMLDIANRLSRGLPMPISDEIVAPKRILIMSKEDSPEHVLRPRLEKMGANMENIYILDEPFTATTAGLDKLEKTIVAQDIGFVMIDPLMSYTGSANVNNTSDVRPITDRLNRIAAATGAAIIGIRHINKSKGLGEARSAGAHSVAWLQGARSALIIGCDPDDRSKRAIGQHKLNLGAESKTTYGFRISNDGLFEWTGESELTIDRMLSIRQVKSTKKKSAVDTAAEFLTEDLKTAGGSKLASEILKAAHELGISPRTLDRAKKKAGVISKKQGMPDRWKWNLPNADDRHRAPPGL